MTARKPKPKAPDYLGELRDLANELQPLATPAADETLTAEFVFDQLELVERNLMSRIRRVEFDQLLLGVAVGLAFALAVEALRVAQMPRVIRSVVA